MPECWVNCSRAGSHVIEPVNAANRLSGGDMPVISTFICEVMEQPCAKSAGQRISAITTPVGALGMANKNPAERSKFALWDRPTGVD